MNILTSLKTRYSHWLEIDLSALADNYKIIKNSVKPGTEILAIVKANAYGHGVKEVLNIACEEGISYFGVATMEEAIEIREAFPNVNAVNILVLDVNFTSDAECIYEYDLKPVVFTYDMINALNDEGKRLGKKAKIHLKIDTGMGRIGVWKEDVIDFIENILSMENIEIEGICSHYAASESNLPFTLVQWEAFSKVVEHFRRKGISFKYNHIANSAGTFLTGLPYFNMVRIGIMGYGLMPRLNMRNELGLKPVMAWRSRVIYCKKVEAGRSIGYGCTYVTPVDTKIATIPIGYADGYMRSLSNKGIVLIKGKRCPIAGRVAMDHIMVDVGLDPDVKVGDEVTLIGTQGAEKLSCEELGDLAGTIPYELACNSGRRAHRIYFYSK